MDGTEFLGDTDLYSEMTRDQRYIIHVGMTVGDLRHFSTMCNVHAPDLKPFSLGDSWNEWGEPAFLEDGADPDSRQVHVMMALLDYDIPSQVKQIRDLAVQGEVTPIKDEFAVRQDLYRQDVFISSAALWHEDVHDDGSITDGFLGDVVGYINEATEVTDRRAIYRESLVAGVSSRLDL